MLQVERGIDLVYGGGSIGLMGLVSHAVHDGGRHVIGYVLMFISLPPHHIDSRCSIYLSCLMSGVPVRACFLRLLCIEMAGSLCFALIWGPEGAVVGGILNASGFHSQEWNHLLDSLPKGP